MFFFRNGEFSGKRHGEKILPFKEVGDEYQKGLALLCFSGMCVICGAVLFVFYAWYASKPDPKTAAAFRTAGIFIVGLGGLIAIPTVVYVVTFYNARKTRKSVESQNSSCKLFMDSLSSDQRQCLCNSAEKLIKDLKAAQKEKPCSTSPHAKDTPPVDAVENSLEEFIKLYESFGNVARKVELPKDPTGEEKKNMNRYKLRELRLPLKLTASTAHSPICIDGPRIPVKESVEVPIVFKSFSESDMQYYKGITKGSVSDLHDKANPL